MRELRPCQIGCTTMMVSSAPVVAGGAGHGHRDWRRGGVRRDRQARLFRQHEAARRAEPGPVRTGSVRQRQPYTQRSPICWRVRSSPTADISQTGLHTTPAKLLNNLHVSSSPNTWVLDVSYDDTDEARGRRAVDAQTVFTNLVNTDLSRALEEAGEQRHSR